MVSPSCIKFKNRTYFSLNHGYFFPSKLPNNK